MPTPQLLPEGDPVALASNPNMPLTEAKELDNKVIFVLLLPLWMNLCWNFSIKVDVLKVLASPPGKKDILLLF